ncbi:HutD/Ves family protein [Luteimonas sp. A277]
MLPLPPTAQVLPANTHRRERWRNGLGWTRAIMAWPDDGDWLWRLSVAEIEQAAPWSLFPGIARDQVLVEGEGLRLRFGDGRVEELLPPHGRARYDGGEAVTGEPIDGRAVALNLMWRRDRLEIDVWRRPLVGPMLFFAGPAEGWLLYLLAGQGRFDHGSGLPPLERGDAAVLASAQRSRFMLDGGGELIAMRLRPREAAPPESGLHAPAGPGPGPGSVGSEADVD